MKVLITGATGFIGSNLTQRLVKLGWKVVVLVRDENRMGRPLPLEKVTVHRGDLSDKRSIAEAAKGVDAIFNCAAALPYHQLSDSQYLKTNVDGLKNILETVKGTKIRLVHLSTTGVYGPTGKEGVDEDSPFDPQDIYAKTKVEGEELIRTYQKKYKISAVIIRPTIAYGPGDTRPGFLNLFRLIKRGIFVPVGDGNNFFHTIYVGNLVDALILAATKKEAIGQGFIVGDELAPKMREIIKRMSKILGKKPPAVCIPKTVGFAIGKVFDLGAKFGIPAILSTQRVKFLTENKRYKIDKAKKILGFRPKVKLKEGLKKTYKYYNDYKML